MADKISRETPFSPRDMIINTVNLSDPKGALQKQLEEAKTTTIARPTAMVSLLDSMHLNQAPLITTEIIEGIEMEVATYKSTNNDFEEFMFAYPKGLQDSEMFRLVTMLYGYANDIGARSDINQPIIFNDFLDWLDYKRDKDNTHNINTKKKVWRAIHTASRTILRAHFNYLIKKNARSKRNEHMMYEKPLIETLVGVYTRNGTDIKTKDYQDAPPDKMIIKFVDFFITQLQGRRLGSGEWVPKNVTLTPKISANLWKSTYQGYAVSLLDFIFLHLKFNPPASGLRNYTKEELIKRASRIERPDMALNKAIQFLNMFEKDKHVKGWGFRQTHKSKPLGKAYKQCAFIWIDFSGTDTLARIKDFRKKATPEIKLEKLEKEVQEQRGRLKGLERINDKYDIE